MNWFERYGIVGMFFILMIGIWFLGLFPDSSSIFFTQIKSNKDLATIILGLCSFCFLPIGYLIVIFGQLIYYRSKIWEKIHCIYWKALPSNIKKEIEDEEKEGNEEGLPGTEIEDEAKIEAILTYYDRMYIMKFDKNDLLSKFATKRYDVIAINRGLMLSIFISFITTICLKFISLNIALSEFLAYFGFKYLSLWLVLLFVSIAWYILRNSNIVLEHQIIEVGKRKFRKLSFKDENKTKGRF